VPPNDRASAYGLLLLLISVASILIGERRRWSLHATFLGAKSLPTTRILYLR